jgi:serine/threonine-protein kinase
VGGDQGGSELSQRLSETLSRFGVAGNVAIDGRTVVLTGNGPTVSADIGALQDEWPALPEDARQRRLLTLARKLAADRRAMTPSTSDTGGFSAPAWALKVAYVAGAGVALLGAWSVFERWWTARQASVVNKPVVTDYDAYERERALRAARVCEATRSRVMRGASVGPSDVEGWVVELWILRDAAKGRIPGDPALRQFLTTGDAGTHRRVTWSTSPLLTSADGPDTAVTVVEDDVPRPGAAPWHGARIVLTGRYVVPYFDEVSRQDYLRFAPAIAEALGADYAALYARCSEGTSHHVGSWFRGPTPAGAVASLLFFMGTFGETPDIRPALLSPPGASFVDRGLAFQNVASATAPLKKARVMKSVGAENGAIAGKDEQVSAITFPFRDANRASRASRGIARELGIADER